MMSSQNSGKPVKQSSLISQGSSEENNSMNTDDCTDNSHSVDPTTILTNRIRNLALEQETKTLTVRSHVSITPEICAVRIYTNFISFENYIVSHVDVIFERTVYQIPVL